MTHLLTLLDGLLTVATILHPTENRYIYHATGKRIRDLPITPDKLLLFLHPQQLNHTIFDATVLSPNTPTLALSEVTDGL
ncbi:hypothetical protein [Scytonema sp. NUACC26]|uniref:hypothetical protein n=1 Tax=Scytonema sp. NUACC26 TaxID=3140176 RepID=UPI0034DCC1D6